jgi:F-type H+-transporting ATPase subunit b
MRIDWWTLALQSVNVLVLIWILARFFFRPIADIVAKRQAEANGLLSDAAKARDDAAAARADVDKIRAGIAAERERLLADAQKAAKIEKDAVLAAASQEAKKCRSEAQTMIARDQAAAEQAVVAHASDLAVVIAQRLLARLPSRAAFAVFLDGLCQALHSLPSDAKHELTVSTADHAIEIVTASPLSDAEQEQIRLALKDALGSQPLLTFRSDYALIAGIELHGPDTVVRNSWRSDLAKIREELDRGKQSLGS